MKTIILFLSLLVSFIHSSPDPNFHIYLAFGQSNMEGQGKIEAQDKTGVPERFKTMPALDEPSRGWKKGNWYTAVPPLCRERTGLDPCTYFGRELVANLPETISVGVINVAVGGCSIDLFDEDKAEAYLSTAADWLKNTAKVYGNHPYKVLVETAKIAQESGVIKGILLHQGESNNGDNHISFWHYLANSRWLLNDLGLNGSEVPLLVGEVVDSSMGGSCGTHNAVIATVPSVIPNSHVVKSNMLEHAGDRLHFTSAGYRELGKRYAQVMLGLLN